VATLGVYAANTAAVRTYLGLGYLAPHTFRSGPVDTGQDSERDITRASEPSG
jgi:hypothetical protein